MSLFKLIIVESGLKATLPILTGCVAIALIHNISDTVNFRGTRFLDKAAKKEVSLIAKTVQCTVFN
jgi:hypothetical protein